MNPPRQVFTLLMIYTVCLYLLSCLTGVSGSAQLQAKGTNPQIVSHFNSCADSVGREQELWQELRASLVRCPPSDCRDARLPELFDGLEAESTLRFKSLKALRAASMK